jgi:ABC-type multidrug transport system ATPase subunit
VTVNRRAVWKLINELKQNRIVILTTHSMEEGTHRDLVPTHLHSEVAA